MLRGTRSRLARVWSLPEVRWAVLAAVAFLAAVLADLAGSPGWLLAVLYGGCYAAGGWQSAVSGLAALRQGRLEVDLLMVVAALAAASIGEAFDGGLLIVIFATSGALEVAMTARTRDSIEALLDLAPETATRLGGGVERRVPVADLAVGDLVLVRPGERLPADGEVVDGRSEVDTASLTGEPLPVARTVGDGVLAGTLNGTGTLRVRVGTDPAESVVARVAAQVEQASETKARRQLLIERIEQRYSVAVVVGALALLGVPLAFGAAFEPTLLRAMTFMIVASPCAVVLATMPPLLAAIANAGRNGLLVKDARVLEALAAADTVALDKTGTVTSGSPQVVAVEPVGIPSGRLLALAAAAEAPSEHVLGRAVAAAARREGIAELPAGEFEALPGRGVRAVVEGRQVTVGDPAGLGVRDPCTAALIERQQDAGRTAVVVLVDDAPVGVLALTDVVRPDAADAVARLAELTGRVPILLTGDNPSAAAAVARTVGITEVRAGLLPQDKTTVVQDWHAAGRIVLVAGDGVNDAPVLATADVGVAMGETASALSLQAADAVVLRDQLGAIPAVVTLARRARRVAAANLAFACAVIVALVTWDLVATLPLALGVAGHETSTLLVCLNGLRLLSRSSWPTSTPSEPASTREPTPQRRMAQAQR